MFKKLIGIIITAAILLGASATFYADDTLQDTYESSETSIEPGDIVTYTVTLNDSFPQDGTILAYDLRLAYNSSVLTFESVVSETKFSIVGMAHPEENLIYFNSSRATAIVCYPNMKLATFTFRAVSSARYDDLGFEVIQSTENPHGAIGIYDADQNSYSTAVASGECQITSIETGDVNMDGKIDILDVTEIQKSLAYIVSFTDRQTALADTNQDGTVSILDATDIQKYLANLPSSFDLR